MTTKKWSRGRGKLGFLQPLLGNWKAQAETPMGPVHCTREFKEVLGGNYVELRAKWTFGAPAKNSGAGGLACPDDSASSKSDPNSVRLAKMREAMSKYAGKVYEEHALIGVGKGGAVTFWSFTSDGKNSSGVFADVTDLHPSAIGFEAQMDAGLARMAYWPDEEDDGDGFRWVVESKTKKGWRRFTEHRYRRA
jgi:hypothetical protein